MNVIFNAPLSKANVPADFSAASVRSDKGGDSSFWVSPSHDSSFEKKTGKTASSDQTC